MIDCLQASTLFIWNLISPGIYSYYSQIIPKSTEARTDLRRFYAGNNIKQCLSMIFVIGFVCSFALVFVLNYCTFINYKISRLKNYFATKAKTNGD